jgi:hypothetical protein
MLTASSWPHIQTISDTKEEEDDHHPTPRCVSEDIALAKRRMKAVIR